MDIATEGLWRFGVSFPIMQVVILALNRAYPDFAAIVLDKRAIPVVAAVLLHIRYLCKYDSRLLVFRYEVLGNHCKPQLQGSFLTP